MRASLTEEMFRTAFSEDNPALQQPEIGGLGLEGGASAARSEALGNYRARCPKGKALGFEMRVSLTEEMFRTAYAEDNVALQQPEIGGLGLEGGPRQLPGALPEEQGAGV
mmetsp:Transcript_52215/g.168145  ORF Transcript_52215/g.168145 Transcript_52215/m.168145 type:complete len:110 (-) Transcript_52215:319-648(-)